jgi:DNA-binding transcriptional MerR regulator
MRAGQVTDPLTVGQLAARAAVRTDTIRYYEREGLLPAPRRTDGEHRRYGPADLDRLLFIRGAQRLGLRLAEIRELLAVRDTGTCACEPAEALLRRHVAEIGTEIERLAALRAGLLAMLAAMPGPGAPGQVYGGTEAGNLCGGQVAGHVISLTDERHDGRRHSPGGCRGGRQRTARPTVDLPLVRLNHGLASHSAPTSRAVRTHPATPPRTPAITRQRPRPAATRTDPHRPAPTRTDLEFSRPGDHPPRCNG